jgi:hypothetical protein
MHNKSLELTVRTGARKVVAWCIDQMTQNWFGVATRLYVMYLEMNSPALECGQLRQSNPPIVGQNMIFVGVLVDNVVSLAKYRTFPPKFAGH